MSHIVGGLGQRMRVEDANVPERFCARRPMDEHEVSALGERVRSTHARGGTGRSRSAAARSIGDDTAIGARRAARVHGDPRQRIAAPGVA